MVCLFLGCVFEGAKNNTFVVLVIKILMFMKYSSFLSFHISLYEFISLFFFFFSFPYFQVLEQILYPRSQLFIQSRHIQQRNKKFVENNEHVHETYKSTPSISLFLFFSSILISFRSAVPRSSTKFNTTTTKSETGAPLHQKGLRNITRKAISCLYNAKKRSNERRNPAEPKRRKQHNGKKSSNGQRNPTGAKRRK